MLMVNVGDQIKTISYLVPNLTRPKILNISISTSVVNRVTKLTYSTNTGRKDKSDLMKIRSGLVYDSYVLRVRYVGEGRDAVLNDYINIARNHIASETNKLLAHLDDMTDKCREFSKTIEEIPIKCLDVQVK